jgi:hypothetical protein
MVGPEIEASVPLKEVVLYALFNPATIAVAFLLGRKAADGTKLMIAAFAGAVAGVAVLYLATLVRLWDAPTLARAAAGIFVTSLVAGFVYAGIGFLMRPRT